MTINFIHEAIASFQECQRIVKHPTNEAEYLEWVIPFDDGSITKTWTDVQTKAVELETEWNAKEYARARAVEYPVTTEFIEAYTEKEILNDDTKWNEYVSKYNQVRTDNPKE